MSVDHKRFARTGGVGIPQASLTQYQMKKASPAEATEGAVPVTSAPRTANAHLAAAPHVAGAAQSERERAASWWRSAFDDPAIVVGVGLCIACYVGVRLMRK